MEAVRKELFNYDGMINTHSGKKMSFIDPKPEQVDIMDIAVGLSNKGHFGGQTPRFFSIAQHSTLVIDLMPDNLKRDANVAMAALLHDASEAYTGDILKPLKLLVPEFKKIEDRITKVIFMKFELNLDHLELIKPYDLKAQGIEYDVFFRNKPSREFRILGMNFLSPEDALSSFMYRFCTYDKLLKCQ